MMNQSLPLELQQLVHGQLGKGEFVHWVGQPTALPFPWVSLFPFCLGVPFTLVALYVIFTILESGYRKEGFDGLIDLQASELLLFLIVILILLFGIAMLTAPWWMMRRTKRHAERTAYVVTDRRAIVFGSGFFGGHFGPAATGLGFFGRGTMHISSFDSDVLAGFQRVDRANGTGNIILERAAKTDLSGNECFTHIAFMFIENVKQVESMLRELRDT